MASLKKRGKTYYAQYYVGDKQVRKCLNTSSLQVAKEKLRKLESSFYRGEEVTGPTKTHTAKIVAAYVDHIRNAKTKHSVKSDLWYLSDVFGPICDDLSETGGRAEVDGVHADRNAIRNASAFRPSTSSRSPSRRFPR